MSFDPPPLPPYTMDAAQFQVYWQMVINDLKATLTDIAAAIALAQSAADDAADAAADAAAAAADALQAIADAAAADAAASAAQTTANTANTTATAVKKSDKISASWTSPGSVLSAADVGANATITIAAHTRYWGDNTSISVSGGTITGRAFSTKYYVYYTDTNQTDTTPSYTSTTNANTAAYNFASGRIFVGSVTTPADGGGSTSGGTTPPGGGYAGPTDIP